eukprot:CAMPEP_0178443896 /NCGR_PEP_ID=MMETSP0689_2-20121128/39168_1 /TAXON_ID=160604 /ORGANISM="Amphidinium massartii, Strain CS-259" /LENGTH=165 /DNA_ID=CAMNT_0020067991 /DNA_START=181 /DNA_END=680 /DNA_ORIENTATION=+
MPVCGADLDFQQKVLECTGYVLRHLQAQNPIPASPKVKGGAQVEVEAPPLRNLSGARIAIKAYCPQSFAAQIPHIEPKTASKVNDPLCTLRPQELVQRRRESYIVHVVAFGLASKPCTSFTNDQGAVSRGFILLDSFRRSALPVEKYRQVGSQHLNRHCAVLWMG